MSSARFERANSILSVGTLQYLRHTSQLLATVFANGKLLGLASTGLIVPYLHVTQSPWSTVHGAYESLEYTIARGIFPLLVLGVIYLTAITVGRLFCGWACPFGLVQDLLSYLPFKKQRLPASTTAQLKDLKYAVLGFSLISVILVAWRRASALGHEEPMGVFSDSPFSVISPANTLFAFLPWLALWNTNVLASAGVIAWIKLALCVAVIVPSVVIPRFFCRYLCPMGTLLEPVSSYKLLRISRSSKTPLPEVNRVLGDVCPMGVQLEKEDYVSDHPSCIHCGKCVTESPTTFAQTILEKS
jgi:ferredoxin-type protein NapH